MKHTEYPYEEKSYEDKSPDEIEEEIQRTRAEMSRTLHALERRLSPGQLVDQALGYFRGSGEGSSEFATNLGRSIKDNPVPVTLMGIGLGWLMLSGSDRSERRYGYSSYSGSYREPVTPSAATTYPTTPTQREGIVTPSGAPASSAVGSSAGGAGAKGQVRQAARGARERAGEMAHGARERAGEMAHEARERAGEMAHGARERAAESAQWARERAEYAAYEAREKMGEAREAARYQARRAKQGFVYMLQEHPLVLGGIGLAVGAALGAGLPPTRKEDEWMGRQRDELLEQAEAVGKEQLHKAEQVAAAAQEAARDEAERQNLTPEAGKEQLREVKQKAEQVAEAAQDAAKQEAKRQDLGSSSSSSTSTSGAASTPGATSAPGSTSTVPGSKL